MNFKRGRLVVLLFLVSATLAAAATIKEVKLTLGRDDHNKIGSPVVDTSKVGVLGIETLVASYDPKAKIVRRGGGGGFMFGAPNYDLDKTINMAALLTDALRSEAPAMGFRLASAGGEPAWEIKGTLKDIYAESRQVYMGSTLFYGFMDVELQVRPPGGEARTERLRAHSFYGAYNAGAGRKDEAQEALAHLLVEGAQEILARLNRTHFKAPPHPDIEKKINALTSATRNDILVVGLSGNSLAVPALLKLLPQTEDENVREAMIEALARIGSPEAVAGLAARYASEDEDCRWAILKAMDYIGGQEAMTVVREKGSIDENGPCKSLAKRLGSS